MIVPRFWNVNKLIRFVRTNRFMKTLRVIKLIDFKNHNNTEPYYKTILITFKLLAIHLIMLYLLQTYEHQKIKNIYYWEIRI